MSKWLGGSMFNKEKKIQNDCIKVLYEIGYRKPKLISTSLPVFVGLLKNKNNRLIWGAMVAIDTITDVEPNDVYSFLAEIMQAIDKGSVITKDAGVEILAKLSVNANYEKNCFPLLMEQLKTCPVKQLAQYAEKTIQAISDKNKKEFITTINTRIPDLENDSQKKRINAVLKKIT
jgi:hypothetical protein